MPEAADYKVAYPRRSRVRLDRELDQRAAAIDEETIRLAKVTFEEFYWDYVPEYATEMGLRYALAAVQRAQEAGSGA